MNELDRDNERSTEGQPEGLRGYLKLRLDLVAMIRSAMELFHQARDPREHRARLLLSHLAEDRFNLVVVGQFKRGKSSLMNAVIGMDRLPTGILPLTSVVTTVRYGDEERVLIRTKGSSFVQEIPLEKLEDYVTEKGNPGNRRHVELAEVLLPAEILRLGFHFIDTPGVGSSIVENTATTHRFLPEADAVVFVTSFESTMNDSELAFLRTVTNHVHNVFFIVNKLDLVTAEESEAVLASVRRMVSARIGVTDPRIFAVSARLGLEAKRSGNPEMLARSGIPEFESALGQFLANEREEIFLLRCAERAMSLLSTERIESRVGELLSGLGGDALRTIKHEWERKMRQIETDYVHLSKGLRRRIHSQLPMQFEPAIARHCTDVRDSLIAQVGLFLSGPGKSVSAQGLRELTDRAASIAEDRRGRWLSALYDELVQALAVLAGEDVDRLGRLYDKALEIAVGLFGVSPSEKWTPSRDDEARFSWRTAVPFDWRPRFAWELDLFPVKWVRKRVLQDYGRTLEVAVAAYREHVAHGLAESGGVWADSLSSGMQQALVAFRTRVDALLAGHEPSATSHQARLLFERLKNMRLELTDKRFDKRTVVSPVPAVRRVTGRCFVCERIEAEMIDFFSERQYQLSASENEQRAHVRIGGFCPLHTWQYAHIASPQGISLAYAPFLAAMARHLRHIAATASSVHSLEDAIGELNQGREKCPACRRMAEAEKTAVREFREMFREQADREVDAGLCVLHLHTVVEGETDLETARNLILEEASTFDRISEDMQTFSLKRDGLRSELLNEGESLAYLIGLTLLVGHRGLFPQGDQG